jgi:hypothetical protein
MIVSRRLFMSRCCVLPPALAARLTAQVLAKADALAPHLNWVRICLADQALVPLYESAFAQIGCSSSSKTLGISHA